MREKKKVREFELAKLKLRAEVHTVGLVDRMVCRVTTPVLSCKHLQGRHAI